MTLKYKNLVFFGPPGAGKGTQANLISNEYNLPHISTGDIFRDNFRNNTPLGLKVKGYMDRGELVPDEIVVDIVKDRLLKDDCKKGFILDGYPRTIPQAEFLDSIAKIDRVLNFRLADDEIIKRISGRRTCKSCGTAYHIINLKPKREGICDKCNSPLVQRDDEKPEVVKERISVYKRQTEPLIDYYKKKKLLVEIDAYLGIEEVNRAVEKALGV